VAFVEASTIRMEYRMGGQGKSWGIEEPQGGLEDTFSLSFRSSRDAHALRWMAHIATRQTH
jgi:hypothetical protein